MPAISSNVTPLGMRGLETAYYTLLCNIVFFFGFRLHDNKVTRVGISPTWYLPILPTRRGGSSISVHCFAQKLTYTGSTYCCTKIHLVFFYRLGLNIVVLIVW